MMYYKKNSGKKKGSTGSEPFQIKMKAVPFVSTFVFSEVKTGKKFHGASKSIYLLFFFKKKHRNYEIFKKKLILKSLLENMGLRILQSRCEIKSKNIRLKGQVPVFPDCSCAGG